MNKKNQLFLGIIILSAGLWIVSPISQPVFSQEATSKEMAHDDHDHESSDLDGPGQEETQSNGQDHVESTEIDSKADDAEHDEVGHEDSSHVDAGHEEAGHEEAAHEEAAHEEAGHEEAGQDEVGHEGHDHSESSMLTVPESIRAESGFSTAVAGPGVLLKQIMLHGEVTMNFDRLAHVTPRVPGVVREIVRDLGDTVKAGDILAVIDSRELAANRADFMAASERYQAAKFRFEQEEKLWNKKISSEQEYLDAKVAFAEAKIVKDSAENSLRALGLSSGDMESFDGDLPQSFTRYEIRSSIAGTIVEKRIVPGEKLAEDAIPFIIADMSTVWVDFAVFQNDLPLIKPGLGVIISHPELEDRVAAISYVSPMIDPETRTALARVELSDGSGLHKPGMFVTGLIVIEEIPVAVLVPKTAVQTIGQETVVFIEEGTGFTSAPVTVGRMDRSNLEILSGLRPGQNYQVGGAFDLKAEIVTGSLDPHAGHGH